MPKKVKIGKTGGRKTGAAGKPAPRARAAARPNKDGRVRVLIGTRKGAFVFTSDARRSNWKIEGPWHEGQLVYHLVSDPREGGSNMLAAVNNAWFGCNIHRTRDGGKTWAPSSSGLRFAEDSGLSLKNIWHIRHGRTSEPGVLYAGVDPGGLFKSEDSGETWSEMLGLNRHATRTRWSPGAGGMCTNSVVLDPDNPRRMYVSISAAGVFRSDDGGETWQPRNKNMRVDFMPEKFPELGQCVHKLVMAQGMPNRLYQQNHCGIYRTEDAGDDWSDISSGSPSRFGFPIAVHPQDPDTIWVIPMTGAEMRACLGGEMAVYRSSDAGRKWQKQDKGLPSKNAYLLVLRETFATDACDPAGLYFGTETGQVFYSRDEGRKWELMADFLPPILSVETA